MKQSLKPILGSLILFLSLSAFADGKTIPATQKKTDVIMSNDKPDLLKKLTPQQFAVTQQCNTEPPFKNAYWDNKEPGIYVDVVDGTPLFSSIDKYDSGTGWPSFTKPLEEGNLKTTIDHDIGYARTEVKSKKASSHLGHVFDDGPGPTGKRYCMNSASLKFIHVKDLEKEGYGEYLKTFPKEVTDKIKRQPNDDKSVKAKQETAILAGGCFWGVEDLLRKVPGVISTDVGYAGGKTDKPLYVQVKTGSTGHAEAVKITYDPSKITFAGILDQFFQLHDPTTKNQQGNDIGTQYRSVIFYQDDKQKEVAEQKIAEWEKKWKKPIVTEVVKATPFFDAEDYHQDYLVKNPGGYTCHYYRKF